MCVAPGPAGRDHPIIFSRKPAGRHPKAPVHPAGGAASGGIINGLGRRSLTGRSGCELISTITVGHPTVRVLVREYEYKESKWDTGTDTVQ